MKLVYLDNAATTPIYPEVIQEMTSVLTNIYGNPSATHQIGRNAKDKIETSRKNIAKNLGVLAQEIIFTSGATEANNLILNSCIKKLGVKRVITSKIEHHAVLHTLEILQKELQIELLFVSILPNGDINYTELSNLVISEKLTLVSLMQINNEIGTILNLEKVSQICKENNALFHCDTVQSIGKFPFDFSLYAIDFFVGSAHKFHGPKGVGFAYIKKGIVLQAQIFGGEQEKGLRAGTESVHNIAGMDKALEISVLNHLDIKNHIISLKKYLITKLETDFAGTIFIGNTETTTHSIINFILPFHENKTPFLLFQLDLKGIAVSRGSACQSGSVKPSHVLAEIVEENNLKKPNLRVSFSQFNTFTDIDYLIETLKSV